MKVTVIPILIGALGTVIKVLIKWLEDMEIRRRVETIQTTALLRSTKILRRVLETWGDLLSLSGNTSAYVEVKNSQMSKIITINDIISECSKLTRKDYKTKHDCVGKLIHWEVCKKLRFDHTTKLYTHKPESDLERPLRAQFGFEIYKISFQNIQNQSIIIIIICRLCGDRDETINHIIS